MKKTISTILATLFFVSIIIVPVAADGFEEVAANYYSTNQLIELAKKYISKYDTNPFKSANGYYLGNEIPMYIMNSENKTASLIEDVKLYPVFRGEEVIFTIIDMGGTRKISDEGVIGINNTLNVSDNFALVTDGNLCVSLTDKGMTVSVEGSGDERVFSEVFITDQVEMTTISKIGIPYIPSNVNIRAGDLNMPLKAQHTPYTCWAACMASFVHKYLGYNLTSLDIVNDIVDVHPNYSANVLNNTELLLTTVKDLFSSVYGINVSRDHTVTDSDMAGIRASIDGGNAVIIGWEAVGASGHVTVLTGYSWSGSNVIYNIMDPWPVNSGDEYSLDATRPDKEPTNFYIENGYIHSPRESLTHQ